MTEALISAWDAVADELDAFPLAAERVRYAVGIKPLLDLPRDARILEVGCGSGRVLRALAAFGFERLVGLEISPARLEQTRRRGPASAELVASEGVPFEPNRFDAVVSTGVIEHVAAAPAWLAQLARVVRRGGVVSLTSDTYMWRWLQQLGLYRSRQPLDQAIWPPRLARWGRRAGLRLETWGGFYNTPDQRYYLLKQLARLRPGWRRIRWYLNRGAALAPLPAGEVAAIREALDLLPQLLRAGFWPCVWSYESFYWFRKK
jgi:SAM-dependent methyltransferase